MKEATGELNMTVFVVGVIAALSAFFYTVIWPLITNSINQTTNCNSAICESAPNADGTVNCYVVKKGKRSDDFTCVWKG